MTFTNNQIEYILDCIEDAGIELYPSEWKAIREMLNRDTQKPSYSQDMSKLSLHMASLVAALTNVAATLNDEDKATDIKYIAKHLSSWVERMNMFFMPIIKMTFEEE